MDLVLDTCVIMIGQEGQSKSKDIDYEILEKIIGDKNNELFVTPFSYAELYYCLNHFSVNEVDNLLKTKKIKMLKYQYEIDPSKYTDPIEAANAEMIFEYTKFLHFLLFEIALNQKNNLDLENLFAKVSSFSDDFYKNLGEINSKNCGKFAKRRSVAYLVEGVKEILSNSDSKIRDRDVWKIIGDTKLDTGIPFQYVDYELFRYAEIIIELFKKKASNNAQKIPFKFDFVDFLNSHAEKNGFCVISTDYELSKYLYRYSSPLHKEVIKSFWKKDLE